MALTRNHPKVFFLAHQNTTMVGNNVAGPLQKNVFSLRRLHRLRRLRNN